jgi:hypothetical protein
MIDSPDTPWFSLDFALQQLLFKIIKYINLLKLSATIFKTIPRAGDCNLG